MIIDEYKKDMKEKDKNESEISNNLDKELKKMKEGSHQLLVLMSFFTGGISMKDLKVMSVLGMIGKDYK